MDIEGDIRRRAESGDDEGAATLALTTYGPELLGFLVSFLGNHEEASEAFAQLGEDLWRGLPGFGFRSSMRTWLYTLARHAAHRLRRSARVRRRHFSPLSGASELVESIRSRTLPHLRTEAKDAIARLRASLEPDDRALLVLRLDRAMSWSEVARVLAPDQDERRAAARLRKRFQLVKDRLRALATVEGLVRGPDDEAT